MKCIITSFLVVLITSLYAQSDSVEIEISDSITLKMTQEPFDSTRHNIVFGNDELVYLIDNKPVFGTDGLVPESKLTSVELKIGKEVFFLKTEGMFDPNLEVRENAEFLVVKNYSGYLIRAFFSIGAGIYCVEWIVIKGESFRTILSNDRKIMDSGFIPVRGYTPRVPK